MKPKNQTPPPPPVSFVSSEMAKKLGSFNPDEVATNHPNEITTKKKNRNEKKHQSEEKIKITSKKKMLKTPPKKKSQKKTPNFQERKKFKEIEKNSNSKKIIKKKKKSSSIEKKKKNMPVKPFKPKFQRSRKLSKRIQSSRKTMVFLKVMIIVAFCFNMCSTSNINLTIKSTKGDESNFNVEISSTILSIKEKIKEKWNYEVDRQRLTVKLKGSILKDSETVESCLKENDTLILFVPELFAQKAKPIAKESTFKGKENLTDEDKSKQESTFKGKENLTDIFTGQDKSKQDDVGNYYLRYFCAVILVLIVLCGSIYFASNYCTNKTEGDTVIHPDIRSPSAAFIISIKDLKKLQKLQLENESADNDNSQSKKNQPKSISEKANKKTTDTKKKLEAEKIDHVKDLNSRRENNAEDHIEKAIEFTKGQRLKLCKSKGSKLGTVVKVDPFIIRADDEKHSRYAWFYDKIVPLTKNPKKQPEKKKKKMPKEENNSKKQPEKKKMPKEENNPKKQPEKKKMPKEENANVVEVKFKSDEDIKWGFEYDIDTFYITSITPNEYAEKIGLQIGLKIIAFNGVEINNDNLEDMQHYLSLRIPCILTFEQETY